MRDLSGNVRTSDVGQSFIGASVEQARYATLRESSSRGHPRNVCTPRGHSHHRRTKLTPVSARGSVLIVSPVSRASARRRGSGVETASNATSDNTTMDENPPNMTVQAVLDQIELLEDRIEAQEEKQHEQGKTIKKQRRRVEEQLKEVEILQKRVGEYKETIQTLKAELEKKEQTIQELREKLAIERQRSGRGGSE